MLKCKSGPLKPYYRKPGEHYWRNASTIGSVGCGTFFGGVGEVFGIAFGGFFERKCAEDN